MIQADFEKIDVGIILQIGIDAQFRQYRARMNALVFDVVDRQQGFLLLKTRRVLKQQRR